MIIGGGGALAFMALTVAGCLKQDVFLNCCRNMTSDVCKVVSKGFLFLKNNTITLLQLHSSIK